MLSIEQLKTLRNMGADKYNGQPIDFTPLDDYYADKAVDIAATGGEESEPPEGWYRDDETGGLKPLGKAATPAPDMVNHPPHYQTDGIECIDAIRAQLTPEEFRGYCKGNVAKYVWRERQKGGDESLNKAKWYLSQITGAK